MKTLFIKKATFYSFVMLSFVLVVVSSCKKDKTCHGKVTVVDITGTPVASAKVHLAAPSVGGDVVYDGITDGSGVASFEVKLPAIFDITATKAPLFGTGIMRLDEEGKSTEVTVKIQ